MRTSYPITGLFVFALVSLQVGMAAHRQVRVCMETDLIPMQLLFAARAETNAIFNTIGVDLKWLRAAACKQNGIAIEFVRNATADVSPNVLAHAFPFNENSKRILIFQDRVDVLLKGRTVSGPSILGHVLAHEIGHMLLETDSHTAVGLMKPRWTERDLTTMATTRMQFKPLHVTMIQDNLDRRYLRAAK